MPLPQMSEEKAQEMVLGILKDRENWGESAGIRVAQYELVNALLVLKPRLLGEFISKDELTLSNRRYAALNAQHEKLKADYARLAGKNKENKANGN